MSTDFMNPSDDLIAGLQAGRGDRQNEIDNLEAENDELKAQIEQMKCCGCCKYIDQDYSGEPICAFSPAQIENPRLSDWCHDFKPRWK